MQFSAGAEEYFIFCIGSTTSSRNKFNLLKARNNSFNQREEDYY